MITAPHHHRFPGITWAHLAAEVDRELRARRQVYPGRVAKGHMTQAEADWQLALAEAWAEDVARFEQAEAPQAQGRPAIPVREIPSRHTLAWRDRRAALLRELDYRARLYPQGIARGTLTQADADQRTRRLECLLALYELGYDWTPANGTWPAWDEPRPTAEQRATRADLAALTREIAARHAPTPQQELAL